MRVRSNQILGNKIRQFKARTNMKMVYKFYHNYESHLSWTSSMEIFLGGIGMNFKTNFTVKSIWQRIRLKAMLT